MTEDQAFAFGNAMTDSFIRGFRDGKETERESIIELLTDLDVIRRDALGHLVAFNTDGTKVIYLEGLENK
jgi:hypothetical protein